MSGGWPKEVLKRLKDYKWMITLMILSTFGSAIAGTINPLLVGKIIDEAIANGDTTQLLILVAETVALLILIELLSASRRYIISTVVMLFTRRLRLNVLQSLLRTNSSFFYRQSKGEIIQRCIDDTKAFQTFSLETLPSFFYELILAVFSVIAVFSIYWPLGIFGILVYFLYLFPVRYYGNKQRVSSLNLTEHEAKIKQSLLWKLQSIRLIKTFGTQEREFGEFQNQQEKWAELVHQRYADENKFRNFPRILDALAPALVFGIGGWQVFKGSLSIGDLVAITRLLPAINAPIRSFSTTFLAFKGIGVKLERVMEYLNLPVEPGQKEGLKKIERVTGNIKFENVSLSSKTGTILNDVSFCIKPGEHIALVGPSGSGKSTILRLLTRMIEADSGKIYIDNIPLNEIHSSSLRKRIGTVDQSTFLFNDSVKSNLNYVNQVPDSEMLDISKAIEADPFVRNLSDGYDTVLGENGKNLSGGQRQRLGIVRALIGGYDILLLDEATAALDTETEFKVHTSIRSIMKGRTCIFVAHRLETVTDLDRILVIDNGRIVEEGTHESLVSKRGLYSELWKVKSNNFEKQYSH